MHDADVVAIRLVKRLSGFNEVASDVGTDIEAAMKAAVDVALQEVPAADLVGALAAHVIAMAGMMAPHDPEAALNDLEQLTTISRLEPGEGGAS